MVDWEINATTIYCDAVDDEVTLLAYGNGKAKCTGNDKYGNPSKETVKIIKAKSKKLSRELGCSHYLMSYLCCLSINLLCSLLP